MKITEAVVLLLGKNKLSEGDILLKARRHNLNISIQQIKVALGKLILLGYVNKTEGEFSYYYELNGRGKGYLKKILKREEEENAK